MKIFTKLLLFFVIVFQLSCTIEESKITTVTGEIPADKIGKTLHHEHLLVDSIGADSTGYFRWS